MILARRSLLALAAASLLVLAVSGSGCSKPTAQQQAAVATVELPSDNVLRDRIDKAIAFTQSNRHLNTKDQAAWQVVHGILVYGPGFEVYHDGQLVGALDHLLGGGALRGWTMRKGDHGLEAIVEAGSSTGQGHEDQWLGYLSQIGLPADTQLIVNGEKFTVSDLISQAQWDIHDGMEATWTLMAFVTYLPLDAQWTAKDGTQWNIPRMVKMEAEQDLGSSACGGTHRMYGLAVAMKRFLESGGDPAKDPTGAWQACQQKIADAVAAAKQYQQPDGSLSTNYFARPSTSAEISKRISTTGHALEFLMVALDDQQLQEPWVTRAVLHLLDCFEKTQKFDLECGALYHAAHGLQLYRLRRFGPPESQPPAAAPAAAAAQATSPGTTEQTAGRKQ